uniref:mRNA 5'-phosphatase n=1 Tax=viral metagenome TaxID=1070528 RepID=A0A6C0CFN3_9ZZZZ
MSENPDFINSFVDSIRKNGELEEYLKYAVKEEYVEFEMIFGSLKDKSKMLNKDQFIRLRDTLSSSTNYISLGNKESLDIRTEVKRQSNSFPSSHRLTIEGLDDIKNYCRNDMLEPLRFPIINKRKYKDPKNPSKKFESIHSSDYPIRVNLKEELPANNTKDGNMFTGDWQKKNKSFRFKKRYSYLTLNKVWRIDLTAIKQTKQKEYFKTFKESGLLREKEIYELEIEYVGNEDNINPFLVAPIIEFAKYANENAFGNPFARTPFSPGIQDMGNFEGVDVDLDTTELYLSDPSPRYGYEFDEEILPFDSPELLPDFITLKEEYWQETKQAEIWQHIKDGFETDGWNDEKYKLIPRRREYDDGGEVIIAEISPNINFTDKDGSDIDVKEITIPIQYIIEDLYAPKVSQDDIWGSGDDMPDPGSWASDGKSGGAKGPTKKGKPKGKYKGKPKAKPFQRQINYKPGKKPQVMIDSSVYNKAVIDDLIINLGTVMVECFKIIYECSYFIPKNVENDIIKAYCKITGQVYKDYWNFIGPQPVSMGIEHLNPYNPHSIVSGYAVTEKADGIRAELFIKDGSGYLLTPKKQLIDTGVKFDTTDNWVFDGEYITKNKKDENISLFMIFDIYYCGTGKQPYELPWYSKKGESRSDIIREFRDTVHFTEWEDTMRIGFKQYFEGPDKLIEKNGSFKNLSSIFKLAKKIVDKEELEGGYEYYTDGLIFLPMFLPVKGTTVDDKVKSIKGTWYQNYKWKPPEENTIDFKVIFYKGNETHSYNYETEDGRKELRKYQRCN